MTIALIGDGSGTSGVVAGVSYAKQMNKLDATVSRSGRLLQEMHSTSSYTIVNRKDEAFDAFNVRVAAASAQSYESMAADLSNQLAAIPLK